MKRLMIPILLLLTLCVAAVGCSDAESDKTTQRQYAEDGYMGLSTANPGILTSPNAHTYGNDATLVDQALRGLPHMKRKTVRFAGGTAVVRIKVDRGLTTVELNALQAEAEQRLRQSMQRYDVRVQVYQ